MAQCKYAFWSRNRRDCVRLRSRDRKFSQRLHPPDSRREVHRSACVGLHEVWHTDQAVGQHSRAELFDSARKMPQVRDENFADVSRCRVSHRRVISPVLSRVWRHCDDDQVVDFFRADRRAGIH